ncbi:MAG TPA: secretin N-terminal domain-containing protein [Verrucomicrobiae bacterium]|jgi:general secretion pathway protein D|nr:secretin N-terminal domain-containing protein [Verrucomicrobiae bacterium]
MNPKRIFCALLLIAPALWAAPEASDPATWQFAQAQPPPISIPQRRVTTGARRTNTPAAFPAFPTLPVDNTPPASRASAAPSATAVPGAAATGATTLPGSAPAPGAMAPGASVPTNAAGEAAIYDYDFPSIPVDQLLDTVYAPLVGRTLLRATAGPSAVAGTTTITLKTQHALTKTEAIVALETVLGMNGITIVPLGDKFAKVVAEAAAGQAGGAVSTNNTMTNLPLAGKFVTQIIQVKYANGQDLSDLLKQFAKGQTSIIFIPSTQTLILRDYSENVARMLEMVEKIDVSSPLQVKPEVIPIKYALASDIATALTALGATGGTSVGGSGKSGANFSARSGSGGGFGSGSGSGFGSSGGYGNQGGYNGGYPGSGGGFGVQSDSMRQLGDEAFTPMAANPVAATARSSFQQNLQKIVAGAGDKGQLTLFGQTKIIADERTNSLLVFANDEDMKMIKDIIAKLDVVLPQVLIEAIIMEINLTGTRNTGISYLSGKQTKGRFTGGGGVNNLSSATSSVVGGGTNGAATSFIPNSIGSLPGGFSYFAQWGNDLNVVLEAVAGDGRVNVLSRPRIQTSHAVPADLFIGNTVPYVTGTQNYGYSSGPSSTYTEKEVGIRLQVLPLINPEGLVEMDIQQDIEQLGPDVQIAGVGGVPTTTKRQAGAKVAVRDGETILLGGFISDSRSKADTGVPFLKDIPGLGVLFKSTSVQNLRTELVIMMRPTVLPTPSIAARVATEERNKLSGVKQAELEIREDERKRNAAIEVQLKKDKERREKEARKHGIVEPDYNAGITNASSIPPIEQ